MMMSLLFLGLTLAEAKLNQTSTRRMALRDFPAECSSACSGISQAYDETICLSELVATAPDGPEFAAVRAIGDGMGLMCHHRAAYECGASSNDCSSVLSSFTAGISAYVSSLDCVCDACPNANVVFAHQAQVAAFYTQWLAAALSGSGPQDLPDITDNLEAICPMITTIECLTSEAACGAVAGQLVLTQLSGLKTECQDRQISVDYMFNYTYTDACVTLSEISSTVGLLQLKLLALGSSLLLSILVE